MKENYEYKKATIEDIDELVRTRITVLRAANKLSDDVDMSLVEKESYEYYKRALETGEHIGYLVYDNGTFIGAGGVSFYQVMPTYHNSTGKKAYIMNMYTAPEYRRQGIAFHTLDLLVKDAREQGVSQIALEATDMGRPLYEKYGFQNIDLRKIFKIEKLINIMLHDKKALNNKLTFIIPTDKKTVELIELSQNEVREMF